MDLGEDFEAAAATLGALGADGEPPGDQLPDLGADFGALEALLQQPLAKAPPPAQSGLAQRSAGLMKFARAQKENVALRASRDEYRAKLADLTKRRRDQWALGAHRPACRCDCLHRRGFRQKDTGVCGPNKNEGRGIHKLVRMYVCMLRRGRVWRAPAYLCHARVRSRPNPRHGAHVSTYIQTTSKAAKRRKIHQCWKVRPRAGHRKGNRICMSKAGVATIAG